MKRVITDAQLLEELKEGKTTREIAEKWKLSVATINERRRRLRFKATSVAVVGHPEAQQLVSAELDTLALLQQCMERLTMLSNAYHEWLLDPASQGKKYAIGPRATEIEVIYETPEGRGRATLQELLRRLEGVDGEGRRKVLTAERKCADPRTELRSTVAAISTTVSQMVELAAMLADLRAMQKFRDSILEEIRGVDEATARRIVAALRSRLVVSGAACGPGTLDSGGGDRA